MILGFKVASIVLGAFGAWIGVSWSTYVDVFSHFDRKFEVQYSLYDLMTKKMIDDPRLVRRLVDFSGLRQMSGFYGFEIGKATRLEFEPGKLEAGKFVIANPVKFLDSENKEVYEVDIAVLSQMVESSGKSRQATTAFFFILGAYIIQLIAILG